MRLVSYLTIVAAAGICSLALADDLSVTVTRPALAGYCVQSLRHELSLMQQALASCEPGITPQQCEEIDGPLRTSFANQERTFNLWRVYGLGLGPDGSSEFLRGVAEANADIAYLSDFLAAHPIPPSVSTEDVEKAMKAAAASDPRIQAIQERGATCQQGPPL